MVSGTTKFYHNIILPTKDIDDIFNKVASWSKKWGVILETQKPFYVKLRIRHKAYSRHSDLWLTEIHLSNEINGVMIEMHFLERVGSLLLRPVKNQDEMPRFPFLVRSLYRHLGIELSHNQMRSIFTKTYLDKYIQRNLRQTLFAGFIIGLLGIYGLTRETFLTYMMLAMTPFIFMLLKVGDITELKSLREKLYNL